MAQTNHVCLHVRNGANHQLGNEKSLDRWGHLHNYIKALCRGMSA